MRVKVIPEDVELGERGRADRCPIARALNRTTGKTWEVYGCCACARGQYQSFLRLPLEATRFVDDFDDGKPVQPFAFEAEEVRCEG